MVADESLVLVNGAACSRSDSRTAQRTDDTTAFLRAARSGNLEKVIEYLDTDLDINTANSNGLNALHLSSKDGHVEIVTELLKRGAKVDAATKKGNTALHIASLAGQVDIVNILIQYGAAVNIQSQNGFTPLYMAAQENHDQVVKLLLSSGANQSLATEDGFTPLAVAMQQGHDKVVSVLLENDSKGKVRLPALHIAAKKDDCKAADLLLQNDHKPDVTSKSGFTPLHISAHYGNEEIARLLIKRGADVNYLAKHNISPLHVAAKWGKNNMVKILLENSAMIDAKTRDGLTPLHCAARSGHEEVVSTLLEHEAPISARTKNGLAPLHMASQGDHVDAARALLYHRAPVDEVTIDYLTSLHVAAHCGHVRVAKLLLDRKADPNARALNGFTPLHIACKKNRIKVVELLLKHGASIESTTESGLTPLHVASFMGCMNIVIFLLQHEANPDVPTVRGETPLHLAARANQTDIIRILLRNGAKVDARAREEQTPLHIASRLGNVDIVMLLLQHGAAVDTTTKDMYTALHIAAKEGQEEVAAILVENHASVKAATKNGFTPLHIAAKYGNMNVAKILLQKDSKLDAQGKNDITPLHLACHYDHSNVANMILEKGASPHLASQNGHTPLHIAARKNQMDIASTLLEHGADPNVQSKAGFTPLQLSAQKGHYDMTNLLIEHGADPNHKAKNGLTALHLCAQEDFIRVASILVKNGANVESETETGYRPIHVAAHFGNLSMIRFLLKHNAQIDVRTNQNYTPLHQAAQQGHAHIVSALLEGNASHNARTTDGLTALNVAQKLGYISVMEVLKGLSYDTLTPDNRTWEEKYKVIAPESLQETSFMSDSDDEGVSDGLINEQPYRYLTADLMKSLRDDSLPIDVTRDDPIDRQVSKEEKQEFVQSNNYCLAETFDTNDSASLARLHFRSFLVSFLVDARGGAMKGCRHSGIRIIVPPRRATMPIRVTCRLIKPSKVANPPSLMEGEALATRIIEMGPVGASFLGPVLIDVPHFASVQGKEREILILRSENGETWKEHDHSYDNDDTLFNTPYDTQMSASHSGRIMRILTTEFPQYFAIVTRIKQEVHVIGADGGILISSVANHVQAVFPPGALTKKIKVGLQAHVIPADLTAKLLGNCVAVSPVITIEPRRRKFHKPITLTIPVPQAANKGMINQYGGETPTLRLLCSIAGGTSEAQWEDVTGSTPLTFMNDRVSFTTTVSARFWLMDCRNISEVPKMATELYKESLFVPFITNFVIYTKRMDLIEATLRILCMTDGKECIHTLEKQEEFLEIVKSRDVEALDGKDIYIEFSGNLVPVTKSGVQLKFTFKAFRQNRLSFHVKVRDPLLDPVARMMFMRDPKVAKGEPAQQPICVLNIVLPDSTVSGESDKKLNEYEDSNITGGKIERFKLSYTKEEGEKGDKPKPSSPSEPKFITDILQKEQTDAATIHESFAQKAACPLESVDASYPSNVSAQDELSPTNEKQTYTEKRKFWEDITRKRENYQRSESELSRTSQLTVNESDSEFCIQNIVSEEETADVALPGRSETMEDLNIPDISECSVAEKAHYFEEQIQKELSNSRPTSKLITQETSKLITLESSKEKDESSTRAPSKLTTELSSEKSEKTDEESIDRKVDKDDWNSATSVKSEKIATFDDGVLQRTTTTEREKKIKDDVVEIRDSVTTTVERIERDTELDSKRVLVEKTETTRKDLVGESAEKTKLEKTVEEETSLIDERAQAAEDTKKRHQEKTRIPSKILDTKKPVAQDFDTRKVCSEFLHHETKFASAPTQLASEKVLTDRQKDSEKLPTEAKQRDNNLEDTDRVVRSETKISTTPTVTEVAAKFQKEDQQPSMIPRKIKSEPSTKPEAKRVSVDEAKTRESLPERQTDLAEETIVSDREIATPEDKESTSPSEKATLKMQEESKQTKKESRIPISSAKAEKEKKPREDIASKLASPTDQSPSTLTRSPSSSASEGVTSPKKEFESRIPKRSGIPKVQEKEAPRKSPFGSETVTETRTTEQLSSRHYRKHVSEVKTKTFSETFVGQPKDGAKTLEEAETKIEKDSSVITSRFDHRASTETKEVSSSDATGTPEKFVKHDEIEHARQEKLAESTTTRATPREKIQERSLESLKSDVSVAQEISMSLKDGEKIVDAGASLFDRSERDSQRSASSTNKDGTVTSATEESTVRERQTEAALKIVRDDEDDEPFDIEDAIERASTKERRFEETVVSEVKNVLPSRPESEEFSSRTATNETGRDSIVAETVEEIDDRTVKEVEARTIAETIIESIQTEIAKRSASLEGIKQQETSDSDSKEYSENTMDMDTKESEVLHDRMADNMMKKFEEIIERRSRSQSQVTDDNEMLPERLRTIVVSHDDNNFEKTSTRGSISVSDDMTKDEESTPHDREESFPSSSSPPPPHPKLVDRDITISPSSISEQIDLDESIESEISANVQSARHEIEKRSLPDVADRKQGDDALHDRGREIIEPGFVEKSRQDSIDVPSLEIDEPRGSAHREFTGDSSASFERYSREPVEFSSIHESPAIESLDKIFLDRDITVSPSTVSEDTNVDFSLSQDRVDRTNDGRERLALHLAMKGIDVGEIEGPPVVSPRLRLKELEIKPVNWMIGDEKIEVSEPLQPFQAFDKELDEYHSSIVEQPSRENLSRDESVDLEQESGARSSEDASAVDSVKETVVPEVVRTPSSAKSSKFTVVPVSELDLESELVENRLDVSCQELVDTLQREYEAKTPTAESDSEVSRYTFETATRGIAKQKTPDFSVHTERLLDTSGVMDATAGDVFIEVPRFATHDKTQDKSLKEETGKLTEKISDDVKSELEAEDKDVSVIDQEAMKISDDVASESSVERVLKISDIKSEVFVEEKDTSDIIGETTKISDGIKIESGAREEDTSQIVREASTVSEEIKTELETKAKDVSQIVEEASDISESIKTELEVKAKDASVIVKEVSKISDDTKAKDASEIVEEASKMSDDTKIDPTVKEKGETKSVKIPSKVSTEPKSDVTLKGLKQTSPIKSTKSCHDESKQPDKSLSPSHPSDTSAFKSKKEDLSSVDLSARYAITVLDQVVKKEIAEVKESLEAAKQDLIEELNENSETVFQIKESPSEFQFKLEPETIPNDLPFLYKAPSIEHAVDRDSVQRPADTEGSPIAKPRTSESSSTSSKDISHTEKSTLDTTKTQKIPEERSHSEHSDSHADIKIIESKESEKKMKKTVEKDSVDFSTEESYSHSAPVPASRSSSDVDAREDGSLSLLAPQPAPRRRQKPVRTSRKVTSESDAGSSSGDSSNYQSCDYEIGSGSRPSSSDVEALQSTLPSGTVSEYETALMSIERSSASRPTSQDYQSAASTLSSRESMKSLNSLSSGHLGSIDSTGELSETLVASEDDEDKDHIDENLECALDEDRAKGSDSSGSEMPMEDAFDKIDDGLPCRMKRSSEMIFQQIVDEAGADEAGADEAGADEAGADEAGADEETRFDECTTEQLPSDTLAEDEEAYRTDSIFMSTDLTSEAYDKSLSSMESKTDLAAGHIESQTVGQALDLQSDALPLDAHPEADEEADEEADGEADEEIDLSESESAPEERTGVDRAIETMQTAVCELLHQASTTSSTSGALSFETVIDKDQKIDRHSPDSDSFELVDKPDIIDDFVVIEEVGREAEEFDSEGKSISIGSTSYTSTKKYDREVENLISDSKDDARVSTSQSAARKDDLFDFESEESPPQASNDDRYSQSLSDDENFEGSKKWMEMQFQNDPRGYDLEYDRGRLEDIKEEEITDFEAGSSRFGSLGSHKGSIGSVGSLRGSFGSATDYDLLAGKKSFSKPTEHDNVSLSSLQEFEHLESAVAMENSKKFQCGSQESVNNGSLPRRYLTGRSGHGDDVSLSSLKDFEGLESICREAHLIELRAREEEDLLDHESPENRYKLENLPRPKPVAEPVSAAGSFNPSTSGSDDYEKRIMEIDEIIRIAQANVEKFDRQDDTTEDISQIEITADAERIETAAVLPSAPAEIDDPRHPVRDTNVMETSTDSLELDENVDKKYNPLCRSSDSLEMKTTIDFPSLSSDSLNNVRDARETAPDPIADQFNSGRRISSDSLEIPLVEQRDTESRDKSSESHGSCRVGGSFDESVERTSTTDTKITNNGETGSTSTSDT